MRWFIFALLMPTAVFAKYLTLTFNEPNYPLNIVNTQIICASLHAHLETDALLNLDGLQDMPFTCKFTEDDEGKKKLIIVLNLADLSTT